MPEDDAVREAALRVVEDRLIAVRATRVRARTTAAVLLSVAVVLAVARSPWWWIAVAVGVAVLALVLLGPGRVERRAELLRRGVH